MGPQANMRTSLSAGAFLWSLMTFDRLVTGPLIHLIYWAGLGVVALGGFSVVGAGVGLALRDEGWAGWLLAIPLLIGGLLVLGALALLWRATCEFYVAVFRISEDLRAMRRNEETMMADRADRKAATLF